MKYLCFPLYDMPTALLFSFLFHDLVMHLGMPRQMTAIYPSHWGHMIATVLLTWRDHRNILLIIIQYDLYLIASCWMKMWISNRFFRANPVMQPMGIIKLLWKIFSLGESAGHSNVFVHCTSYELYMDCWWKPLHMCLQKCFI